MSTYAELQTFKEQSGFLHNLYMNAKNKKIQTTQNKHVNKLG